MTNIIEFKPKAADGAEPPKVAPNKYYWLEDLHMAAAYAGLVSRDIEALKLLTEAKFKMLEAGKALTRLPLDVRTQGCKHRAIRLCQHGKQAAAILN